MRHRRRLLVRSLALYTAYRRANRSYTEPASTEASRQQHGRAAGRTAEAVGRVCVLGPGPAGDEPAALRTGPGDGAPARPAARARPPIQGKPAAATANPAQGQGGQRFVCVSRAQKPVLREGAGEGLQHGAAEVIQAIKSVTWDGRLPARGFVIGYEDRFLGLLEKSFTAFEGFGAEIAGLGGRRALAIPTHRIRHVKYKGELVWDRAARYDVLRQVISEACQASPAGSPAEAGEALGVSADRLACVPPDRPHTHFVCIRVATTSSANAAHAVRQHLAGQREGLSELCLPPAALHLTLGLVCCPDPAAVARLGRLMTQLGPLWHALLADQSIRLHGVRSLRGGRLLYTRPTHPERLAAAAYALQVAAHAEGLLNRSQLHSVYEPHVTLLNLRPQHEALMQPGWSWDPISELDFGTLQVTQVLACVAGPWAENHEEASQFYPVAHRTVLAPFSPVSGQLVVLQRDDNAAGPVDQGAISADYYQNIFAGMPHSTVRDCVGSTAALQVQHSAALDRPDRAWQLSQGGVLLELAEAALLGLSMVLLDPGPNCPLKAMDTLLHVGLCAGYIGCVAAAPGSAVPAEASHPLCVQTLDGSSTLQLLRPSYSCLQLTSESSDLLLTTFPPAFEKVTANHVTLRFAPSASQLDELASQMEPESELNELRVVASLPISVQEQYGIQAVTVQIPAGLSCANEHPHVTLSARKGVANKTSNDALASAETLEPIEPPLTVSARLVVVYRAGNIRRDLADPVHVRCLTSQMRQGNNKSGQGRASAVVGAAPEGAPSESNDPVRILHIFDFDQTLFMTTDPVIGRLEYKELTGRAWPHQAFLAHPESLMWPFKQVAGPALATLRDVSDQRGASVRAVIVSGRRAACKQQMAAMLARENMSVDSIILRQNESEPSELKPSGGKVRWDQNKTQGKGHAKAALEATAEWKGEMLSELLEQHPGLRQVHIYEDDPAHLKAYSEIMTQTSHSCEFVLHDASAPQDDVPGVLGVLQRHNRLAGNGERRIHAQAAAVLRDAWCEVVGYAGKDANCIARIFGSSRLWRRSDVDLCLIGPLSMRSHAACAEALQAVLQARGVVETYIGAGRVPRLACRVAVRSDTMGAYTLVELDAVFCLIADHAFVQLPEASLSNEAIHQLCLDAGDAVSQAAIDGPIAFDSLRKRLVGETGVRLLNVKEFGRALETILFGLERAQLKSNLNAGVRTFQWQEWMAEYLQQLPEAPIGADVLVSGFVRWVASLNLKVWQDRLHKSAQHSVPVALLRELHQFFIRWAGLIQKSGDAAAELQCLISSQDRPRMCGGVTVTISCGSGAKLWRLLKVAEVSMEVSARRLFDAGLVPLVTTQAHGIRDTASAASISFGFLQRGSGANKPDAGVVEECLAPARDALDAALSSEGGFTYTCSL